MTAPRHIVHIIPRCIGGGPERSILATARECREAGMPIARTMVVLDPPVTPTMFVQARREGVEVITRFDQASLAGLVASCDVVHVHYWNHPALRTLMDSFVFPRCRVVVTAHILGTTLPQVLPADVGLLADVLVLTADHSRQSPGALAAPVVHTVPSIIDRKRLELGQRHSDAGTGSPVVGYLGSLSATKLHPEVAELCVRVTHPTARFVFRGSGADPAELADQFALTHLADRVTVGGSTEDIAGVLHDFDVFGYPLAPQTFATSDRVLQEAMWVGVAPVVLNGTAAASLVQHEVTGLVVDERHYPGAVDRLLNDPHRRRQLGTAARDWARSTLDPTRANNVLLAIYDVLCASPKRLRGQGMKSRPPVAGESAAMRFVRSLGGPGGDTARDFAVSLGVVNADITTADAAIARSPLVLSAGEGGIVHYRNTFPDDPFLRWWSALSARHTNNTALAESEAAAARALGLANRAWP